MRRKDSLKAFDSASVSISSSGTSLTSRDRSQKRFCKVLGGWRADFCAVKSRRISLSSAYIPKIG